MILSSASTNAQDRSAAGRAVLALLVAATVGALGGCDAANVQSEDQSDATDEAQVTAESFDRADLQYEPVSLKPGETFTIELTDDQIDRGVTRIVHEGTPDGRHRLRAHFAPLQPSSVTVTCRNERTGAEQAVQTLSGKSLSTGTGSVATTNRDPDSYHYIDNGDNTIVEVDYDVEPEAQTPDAGSGAAFDFVGAGTSARCTHVSFALEGVSTDLSADGIRFGGDVKAPRVRDKKLR